MARKKKVTKKKSKSFAGKKSASLPKRIGIAWKNLLLFAILFLASYILYSFSQTNLFLTFFGIMSIVFGFIAAAFLIALIVLVILGKR